MQNDLDPKGLSVAEAMAQLAVAVEAEARRNAQRNEMLSTLIVNLEKSEPTAELAVLMRDYVRAERPKLSATVPAGPSALEARK